jgi:hypothetical protein
MNTGGGITDTRTNKRWCAAYFKMMGGAVALIVLVLGAKGITDAIERDTEDRIAYRAWVADACTPNPGELAVAANEGGKLRCTIYSNAGYGLAPIVVSAAVMDVPQ